MEITEQNIKRAAQFLSLLDEIEVIDMLRADGASDETVYLLIQAGKLYLNWRPGE